MKLCDGGKADERGEEGKKATRQLLRSHCKPVRSLRNYLPARRETARNITRKHRNARRLMALRDSH